MLSLNWSISIDDDLKYQWVGIFEAMTYQWVGINTPV
jgi:hypothetical protein